MFDTNDDVLLNGAPLNEQPTDDGSTFTFPQQVQEQPKKEPWELAAEKTAEVMQSRFMEALKTQRDEFEALLNERVAPLTQPQPVQPVQDPLNPQGDARAVLNAKLARMQIEDPVGFLQLMKGIAQSAAQQNQQPFAMGQARIMYDNFVRAHQDDPQFAVARGEFESLIQRNLSDPNIARYTPEQLQVGLDALYSTAIGNVARKRASENRRNVPPNIGGGSTGGGNSSIDLESSQMVRLSPVEKQLVDSAREYGMSEEDVAAALKAYREEGE